MSKKITDQKSQKQAKAKKPVELKENDLERTQGGFNPPPFVILEADNPAPNPLVGSTKSRK